MAKKAEDLVQQPQFLLMVAILFFGFTIAISTHWRGGK